MDKNRGVVELEPELSEWLNRLPVPHFATVAFYLDLLADHGPALDWPYARQLDSKLRELRFHLDGRAVRITYWISPERRIVPLTVFMKNRMRAGQELGRARQALKKLRRSANPR
jgi:hypothetical protein